MGSNQRKRSRSSTSSAWKPVSVVLPTKEDGSSINKNNEHNDDEFVEKDLSRNHYDDPKLSKQAALDLQMNPGEDCAMFYGLEVLDSSHYEVVGSGTSKRLIIKDTNNETAAASEEDQQEKKYKDDSNDDAKKKKKKRKKDAEQLHEEILPKKAKKSKELTDDDDKMKSDLRKDKRKKKKDKKSNVNINEKENDEEEQQTSLDSKQLNHESNKEEDQVPISPEQLATIQSSWGEASGGANIHARLLESLHRLGFSSPTPIQAATLSASIMGRRNLVGAAPTGSGKKYYRISDTLCIAICF
jgi:ATP-dependent RNA helicase DDX24/MAK5